MHIDETEHDRARRIQSVLFDQSMFTIATARHWLRMNHFNHLGVDHLPYGHYFRFRQLNPRRGTRYRTYSIVPGIKAIFEF